MCLEYTIAFTLWVYSVVRTLSMSSLTEVEKSGIDFELSQPDIDRKLGVRDRVSVRLLISALETG